MESILFPHEQFLILFVQHLKFINFTVLSYIEFSFPVSNIFFFFDRYPVSNNFENNSGAFLFSPPAVQILLKIFLASPFVSISIYNKY